MADKTAINYQQEWLLEPERLEPVKGKTIEALAYSRQKRDDLVRLFQGLVPQSVMVADKNSRDEFDLATDTYTNSGEMERKRAKGVDVSHIPDIASFEMSGRGSALRTGVKSTTQAALSKFPQNIGRSIVLLYSDELANVVDPFAGHNSRMELCVKANRNYYGQDLSHTFTEFNKERAKELRTLFPHLNIELYEGPSQQFQVPDNFGDFTITSPPYWDIEYYGDEPNQLGFCKTYDLFINELEQIARENFRALKPGAFCVWAINDFRKNGKFYPYHVDTMNLLNRAGFVTWDIAITDFGRTFRSAFVNQIVEQKILPKRHEYNWVMRKPGWK